MVTQPSDAPNVSHGSNPTESKRLLYFAWGGFFVGGLLPVAVPLFLERTTKYNLIPKANEHLFEVTFIAFVILATPILFLAHNLQTSHPAPARWLRTGCAILSIAAVTVFVWLTGGSISSPFAFSYLYIPALVVVSFRDRTTWLCTMAACFFCYLITLFYPSPDGGVEWVRIEASASYLSTSLLVFLAQLTMTIVVPMTNGQATKQARGVVKLSRPQAQRFGWYLFDFGNSLLISAGSLYFAPWLMDMQVNVAWLAVAIGAASALSLVLGPVIGLQLDKGGTPRGTMIVCSVTMASGTLALHFVAAAAVSGATVVFIAFVAFAIIYSAYQLSLVPYNALLRPLTGSGNMDRVSGFGAAWGWAGMIVGAIAVVPFVAGPWQFNPAMGRAQAFLPATVIYSAVTIVSLMLVNETARVRTGAAATERLRVMDTIRLIAKAERLRWFALFFLLYADATITLEAHASAVMEALGNLSDSGRSLLAVITLVAAAVGSLVVGTQSHRWAGHRLRVMGYAATIAAVAPAILAVFPTAEALWVALPLTGLSIGAVRASARAAYSAVAPREALGRVVGVFSSLEKAGSIVGPLSWSIILFATDGSVLGYRIGLAEASLAVMIGLLLLARIPSGLEEEATS